MTAEAAAISGAHNMSCTLQHTGIVRGHQGVPESMAGTAQQQGQLCGRGAHVYHITKTDGLQWRPQGREGGREGKGSYRYFFFPTLSPDGLSYW